MVELLIVIFCILINAILALSETAFISVSKASLNRQSKLGNKKADIVLKLRDYPEKTLSIVQVGITFIGTVAAAVGGAGAEEMISPLLIEYFGLSPAWSEMISIGLVVLPITFASVIIGELVPKSIALKRSLYFSLLTGPWLDRFGYFIHPLTHLLEGATRIIIRWLPLSEESNTEKSLEIGDISDQNQQYIYNIVEVEQMSIVNILVPWKEVNHLTLRDSLEDVENLIITSGHTRLPVVDQDKIVGILNSKEFLALLKTKKQAWHDLIRPAILVTESDSLLPTLRKMQRLKKHMAICIRQDKPLGIITLEGILEVIVGDIYDENDEGVIKRILSQRK